MLIISVIILTFIGAILSGILLQSRFIQKDINRSKALYLAEQQLYEYLINPSVSHPNIETSFLNGYHRIRSLAKIGNSETTVQVVVGEIASVPFFLSTVVLNEGTPLTLTGNTILKGDYAISNNTMTTSSFRGFPFRGSLVGAPYYDSVNTVMNLSNYLEQAEWYETLFQGNRLNRFESVSLNTIRNELGKQDTLYASESLELDLYDASFLQPFVLIVDGNLSISGSLDIPDFTHIIVSDSLFIEGELKGDFIQLYAEDYISISDQVELSAQVFSRGIIEMNDQSYLTYPSVLYSGKDAFAGGSNSVISISDQAIIDGTIIFPFKPNLVNREQLKITIGTTATVRGAIYSRGLTELFGTVYGSVITDQFYFYESPTSYFNWIKDATIDITQRPADFVIPVGFSDSANIQILDWRVLE